MAATSRQSLPRAVAGRLPDARSAGERLIAFVVPCAGEALTEAEVQSFVADRLVAYKCPAEVRIVEQLPMTGAQKLDRLALRRVARSHEDAPAG